MRTVETVSGFENNSAEEVLRGYYDDAVIIDAAGVECAVTEVLIQYGPWWTRLPLIFHALVSSLRLRDETASART